MRLFLAEKPSQGKDLARVLGADQRGDGCFKGPQLAVTWCIGHLVEAAPPEAYGTAYKRWSLDALPIIPDRWRLQVKSSTAAQFQIVQKLVASASEIIIATDADREGEMIAREILDLCAYRGKVQRLWLSAMNDASIRKALATMLPDGDTLPLYHAALARARADWMVGINLSRLFTILGRQAGYDGVLSVGRVQTPTLQLVVRRDREIEQFRSVPYWAIDVKLQAGVSSFTAQWQPPQDATNDAGLCTEQPWAQTAAQQLRHAREALVLSVSSERIREPPPLPFDLSTLQETCSRQLGLDVQETLNIAQSLYEAHKATTYPRSDCGYLPESMLAEVPTVLDALLVTDSSLHPLVESLDVHQRSRAWNDSKITAHHGIIPTLEPTNLSRMSESERAVYRLIRAHYLAQFLPAHESDRTLAQLSSEDQALQARGKRIVQVGWRIVLADVPTDIVPSSAQDGEVEGKSQSLPILVEGTRCVLTNVELKALRTQPPKPYTQGELIRDMRSVARFVTDLGQKKKLKETAGLGTVATQAGTVQGLINRGYLLPRGRAIRASDKAFVLIDAVPGDVANPGTTAIWEQDLDLIAAGQMRLDDFVAKQSAWVAQLVSSHAHTQLALAQTAAPACPLCNGPMHKRSGKQGAFWSCASYPRCKATRPIEHAPQRRKPGRRRAR